MSSAPNGSDIHTAEPSAAAVATADAAAAVVIKTAEGANGDSAGELNLAQSIELLKKQQAAIRAERKKVSKDLKNASKRASRLKKRARALTDDDLMQVIKMRHTTTETKATSSTAAAEK